MENIGKSGKAHGSLIEEMIHILYKSLTSERTNKFKIIELFHYS